MGLRIRKLRAWLSNSIRVLIWDVIAAIQSQDVLESSYLLWQSTLCVTSRRISSSSLGPYLCLYPRQVIIEPEYGFVIADYGVLLETSVSNAYVVRDPRGRGLFGFPSLLRYLNARFITRNYTEFISVVSLAQAWADNYFHFYRDFLPKILLLEKLNIDPSIPVIVSDKLYKQPFFLEAIRSERLSRWKFIAPGGCYVRSESIVFCSDTQWVSPERLHSSDSEQTVDVSNQWKLLESPGEVLGLLDLDRPGSAPPKMRRIFLGRSAARGRTIQNFSEVKPVLLERDFELVDSDGMSLAEQAQLFREARYVVGIHGAGLINLVHAQGRKLDLLEIREPGGEEYASDFAVICRSLGFARHEIFGQAVRGQNPRDSFQIKAADLRNAIDDMLASRPT